MTYAVQQDLVDRFGELELAKLTDRVGGEVIDPAVLGRALIDADAEIDGYLAARYQLPLATIPAVIVRLACDLARYRLHDDRVTVSVRQRYEDAVRDLKAISAGSIAIDAASPPAAAIATGAVQVSAPDRVFSANLLASY